MSLLLLLLVQDPDAAQMQERIERARRQGGQCIRAYQRAADGTRVQIYPTPYAVGPDGGIVPHDPDNPPLMHYAFALSVNGCPIPVVNPGVTRPAEDFIRELSPLPQDN